MSNFDARFRSMLLHPTRRIAKNIVPIAGTLRRSIRLSVFLLSGRQSFFFQGSCRTPFGTTWARARRVSIVLSTCFFFRRRAHRATWNTRERRINISSNGLRAPGPTPRERRRNPLVAFIPAPLSAGCTRLWSTRITARTIVRKEGGSIGLRNDRSLFSLSPFFFFFPPRSHLRQSNWKAIYPSAR